METELIDRVAKVVADLDRGVADDPAIDWSVSPPEGGLDHGYALGVWLLSACLDEPRLAPLAEALTRPQSSARPAQGAAHRVSRRRALARPVCDRLRAPARAGAVGRSRPAGLDLAAKPRRPVHRPDRSRPPDRRRRARAGTLGARDLQAPGPRPGQPPNRADQAGRGGGPAAAATVEVTALAVAPTDESDSVVAGCVTVLISHREHTGQFASLARVG